MIFAGDHRKSAMCTSLGVVLALFLLTGFSTTAQAVEPTSSMRVPDLVPPFEDFEWTYFGIGGYGHEMVVESILREDDRLEYEVLGEVFDLSGGEAGGDFSLTVRYTVQPEVLIQEHDGEQMLESRYDRVELIRTPLEEGNSWTQEVADDGGEVQTLECVITNVKFEDGLRTYTVEYRDMEGPYWERREITEGLGITSFARYMSGDDADYEVGYSIHREGSGVDIDGTFQDVESEAWFIGDLGPLVVMELFEGYPDGTFRPDSEITAAEFIKLIVAARGYHETPGEATWYTPYVERAMSLGILEEGLIEDLDLPISREVMTVLMVRAIGETPVAGTLDFDDADAIDSRFRDYVTAAVDRGIIAGYPDGSFRPGESASRAEAAKLLWATARAIEIDPFLPADALELEREFRDRLFQETVDGEGTFPRVRDFDDAASLVDYLAEIMDRALAEEYVEEFFEEDFYDEDDGALYLIPRDGPTFIEEEASFQLHVQNPRRYYLIQDHHSELVGGRYRLRLDYRYSGDSWIILNRQVEVLD